MNGLISKLQIILKDKVGNKGQILAKLAEDISDSLFFTVITVSDELNAYKVFETLNSRGVRLSSTDLLKNYIFSIVDRDEEQLKALEERWDEMVNKLQSEKFPDFLRVHWNSRKKLVRQSELFKTIRRNVSDTEGVFLLLRGMEEDLDNYISLISPEAQNMDKFDKENASLLKMLRVKQPFSLLLAAKRKFTSTEFSDLLRAVKVISFRYNTIGGYSPTELERVYNAIAEQISQDKITKLVEVWPLLKSIYIEDSRFKHDFSNKVIKTEDSRSKKVVKYILCEIENYISQIKPDYNSDSFNIEHILPQNAPDDCGDFTLEESEAMLYRLGNMTLLNSGTNRDIGNECYGKKIESKFPIIKKLKNSTT